MVRVRRSGRSHHVLLCCPVAAVRDVLADCAVEEPGVLEDHSEHPSQLVSLMSLVSTPSTRIAPPEIS